MSRKSRNAFHGYALSPSRPMFREVLMAGSTSPTTKPPRKPVQNSSPQGRPMTRLKPEVQRKRPRIPTIIGPLTSTNFNAAATTTSAERDGSNNGTEDRAQMIFLQE
ncbi:hypothetical protein BT96DRAFT_1006699 [Gymnopus androsaceus JB14]|uniref:Uncharacterized protein n=1 Tax=Gymnopus androsaceus JB14 TaxID=1447944 RepID=A0A6A4GK84_9AGAR|nr:hypothetical protein BT96DRAFT_1006699 [Gymnopus androsaceus JB14]